MQHLEMKTIIMATPMNSLNRGKIIFSPKKKTKGVRGWIARQLVNLANWVRPGNEEALAYYEEEYKRGREDEAIECQKDMERVVEETKREVMKGIKVNQKEFVRLANEVSKILEEEKRTMTGAYDVTTRAGKKGKR